MDRVPLEPTLSYSSEESNPGLKPALETELGSFKRRIPPIPIYPSQSLLGVVCSHNNRARVNLKFLTPKEILPGNNSTWSTFYVFSLFKPGQ